MSLELLAPGITAMVIAWAAVRRLGSWARARQFLDVPNDRSSHTEPTPRVGGLGILLGVGGGMLTAALLGYAAMPHFGVLAGGAAAFALLSLVDDFQSLPALARLAGHLAIAGSVVLAVGEPVFTTNPAFALLATLWIVGMVNAYNFMDGIDGIAAGQAAVAALGWAVVGYTAHNPALVVLSLVVCGAVCGFLKWNWPPARVFMGDAGSAFLGYTFAVLPIAAGPSRPGPWLSAGCLLWIFLFDTSFTLLRRVQRRENVLRAHRSHLYQRLVATGLTHKQVTLAYVCLAVAGVPAAVLMAQQVAVARLLWAAAMPPAALVLWSATVRREQAAAEAHDPRQAMGHAR